MERWVGAVAALATIIAGAAQAAGKGPGLSAADPHAIFSLATPSMLDRIERSCASRGEPVRQRQEDTVVCEMKLALPERIAARVMLREPFVRSPRVFIRYTAASVGENLTRVDITGSVDDARSVPHRRVQSLSGARFAQHGQELLKELGEGTRSF